MRLFLLRHEERPSTQVNFRTELTDRGKENANKLVKKLQELNIDVIYSSPYIRTLQTINPYAKDRDIMIKVDYSLHEYVTLDFTQSELYDKLSVDEIGYYHINEKYQSLIDIDDIAYPETPELVFHRVANFLLFIVENYKNTNHNIILVSHMYAINAIIKYFTKDRTLYDLYPMGFLSEICLSSEENYIVTPINLQS